MTGRIVVFLLLCVVSHAAWAIDPTNPTITGQADIASRRTTLINQVWGIPNLPSTLPAVTNNITSPFNVVTYNIARVDQYTASMANGQSNVSNFYTPNSPNLNRAVILNPGHQVDCDWTTFSGGYRIQPVLQALLVAGYSVYAMNQPPAQSGSTICGDGAAHQNLFTNYGNAGMGPFLEPAVQAMNYWDANYHFRDYSITGLSGGGWTAVLMPALDLRIKTSIPVGSTWPGIIWNPTFNCGVGTLWNICGDGCVTTHCTEINWDNFFAVAGFADLYIMGSYGPNRRMFHILNYDDDCCWGNTQYVAIGAPSLFGVDYVTYLRNWSVAVKQKQSVAMPFNYDLMIDYVATQHQISTNAQQVILSILGSVGPGTVGGGRRLLHIW